MPKIDAVLIFGCGGNKSDNFIFCPGVQNIVLELNQLNQNNYNLVVNFLDKTCHLFDYIVDETNKCLNILNLLYKDFQAITEKTLNNVQSYIIKHKGCQFYLMLILREDLNYV